jgi:hypothetical protein
MLLMQFFLFLLVAPSSVCLGLEGLHHNGVRALYCDFPREPLQKVEYRWPPPHHFSNCICYFCPVYLCRTYCLPHFLAACNH